MTQPVVIWDLGNVLVQWRPEDALQGLYPDAASLRAAMAEADFFGWNARLDAGADWDEAEARGAADHPRHAALFAAYRANIALAHRHAIAGSVALLRALDDAGLRQLALSNAPEAAIAAVRARHDFMAVFADVAVSATERVCKPEAEIFRRLLDRNGLSAREAIFIDDSAPNVAGAAAFGLTAIHFTGPESLADALNAAGLPVGRGQP